MLEQLRRKHKIGFTFIEVSLFLAITGLILVGIISTTAGQIGRHRYNDTVQDFASFLMGLYSSATNVQNDREGCADNPNKPSDNECGRSDMAAYGYFAIFGYDRMQGKSTVHTYNLQGAANIKTGDFTNLMEVLDKKEGHANVAVDLASQKSYDLLWDGRAETEATHLDIGGDNNIYNVAIAIVRSPLDGTLYTYTYKNEKIGSVDEMINNHNRFNDIFVQGQQDKVDFCVWSPDLNGTRRDVRVNAAGRTASAVETKSTDEEDNPCR